MAQAYSYFLIEYEKVDIFLIQNKDNINHKSFFQKWLFWNIVVEWACYGSYKYPIPKFGFQITWMFSFNQEIDVFSN